MKKSVMFKHLVIMVGIPASGKSTAAAEYGYKGYSILEKDNFRKVRYDKGEVWSKKLEREIMQEHKAKLVDLMKKGLNIVIADTNLNPATRDMYYKIAYEFGYTAELDIIECDFETAITRNATRDGWRFVSETAMRGMQAKMIEQFPTVYEPDYEKDTAYVFDIDGTLAHRRGRSPFDWKHVGNDLHDNDVLAVLVSLYNMKYNIILLSGRDEVCRLATKDWLRRYFVPYHELYMRPEGSKLKDTALKHDLFHKHVAPRYRIMGVFDDRPSVCRMWRSINVKTFQVGDPHKEF